MALMASTAVCTPPVTASEARTRPERIASQRSRSSSSEESERCKRRRRLERLEVDVGLVEAVEEHQAVGAERVELVGEVREGGEERRQLHRHRDA